MWFVQVLCNSSSAFNTNKTNLVKYTVDGTTHKGLTPSQNKGWVSLSAPVQPCVVCRVRFYGFGTKTWPTSPEHCSSSQPAPCSMHWAEAVHPAYRPAWGRFWAGLAQKHAAGSAEVRSVDKAHVRVIAFLLFRWNSIWAVGSKHKTTHYYKTRNNKDHKNHTIFVH